MREKYARIRRRKVNNLEWKKRREMRKRMWGWGRLVVQEGRDAHGQGTSRCVPAHIARRIIASPAVVATRGLRFERIEPVWLWS